nr:hypothetical protein [Bryobacter aggregatus]
MELGYFRDNGVFFYVSQGPDWITVSDLLSGGDSLMTDDMLFKIPFQYISSTEGPLFVTINEEFTFLDGRDFVPLPIRCLDDRPNPGTGDLCSRGHSAGCAGMESNRAEAVE